jgi:hypothetical protein
VKLIPIWKGPENQPHYGWSLDELASGADPVEWAWIDDGASVVWSAVHGIDMLFVPGRSALLFPHEVMFLSRGLDLPLTGGPVKPPESE